MLFQARCCCSWRLSFCQIWAISNCQDIVKMYGCLFYKNVSVLWWKLSLLLFAIAGMQWDSSVYCHHPAVTLWLLYDRCLLLQAFYMHVFCVSFCPVWEWAFAFFFDVPIPRSLCYLKNELVNCWGPGLGMLWPEHVVSLLWKKWGKIRSVLWLQSNYATQSPREQDSFWYRRSTALVSFLIQSLVQG